MNNNIIKIELLYNNRKKSVLVAYLLGAILGSFGVHYFYAGKNDWGFCILALLALALFTGGATLFLHTIFVLVGVIHTYFVVEDKNKEIYDECKIMVEGVYEK